MADYIPPDIPDDDLIYRPIIVSRLFSEEIEAIVNIWTARYPSFTRYDAIIILEQLKSKLEDEENRDRRRRKAKKKEPEHGQYIWIEHRQQFVLINGLEAATLHLQDDADRSTEE